MNYVVQPGDTVFSIAQRFGITAEELIRANRLPSPVRLFVGQTLFIPVTVPEGDINRRVERLERRVRNLTARVDDLTGRVDDLTRRVDRLERRR